MTHDREPLTPEERALAERLARTAPRAEPSPALDARILAAARAATSAARPPAPSAPRRRWPATLGIAATLALTAGIAWQLRPLPEQVLPATSEAPVRAAAPRPRPAEPVAPMVADVPMAGPAEEDTARRPSAPQEAAPEHRELAPPPAAQPPATRAAADTAQARTKPDAQPDTDRRAQEAGRPEATDDDMAERPASGQLRESAIVYDAPSPVSTPAPAPPPPPSAPAPAEPAFVPSPPPTETAIGRKRVLQRAAPQPGADAAVQQQGTLDRIEVTGTRAAAAGKQDRFDDQPLDDEPPATADSPEVHKAWLARIRELQADGDRGAARASLREFHRRHPDVPLPDDLRGLLDE